MVSCGARDAGTAGGARPSERFSVFHAEDARGQTPFYRRHIACGTDSNANLESLDQHVPALVAMEHAGPDLTPDTSIRGKTWLQVMCGSRQSV